MSRFIVLMYHALYRQAADLEAIIPEDRPYAVSLADFRGHLAALAAADPSAGNPASAVADESGSDTRFLLTFDDGHTSGHALALPELLEFKMKAVFFVTTDFVDQRAGFCSRRQIRELSDLGMAVESHGKSHRFFDTLSAAEARLEFRESRQRLEDMTGHRVTAISFPGGRYRRRTIPLGVSEGYERFFGSDPGINHPSAPGEYFPLRRYTVRADMHAATLTRLLAGDRALEAKLALAAGAKRWARYALGSRGYHWAYKRWAARR